MLNENVIHQKLVAIADYIGKLEPITEYSFKEYQGNYFTKHTAERLIELIVESAIDINGLIIIGCGEPPPKDYYTSFIKIGNLGVYPEEFGKRIAASAGLRNRLVHEYEEVKDKIVYKEITRMISLYQEYIKFVTNYLKRDLDLCK